MLGEGAVERARLGSGSCGGLQGAQNANVPPPNGIAIRLEQATKFAHEIHARLTRVSTLLGGARPTPGETEDKVVERYLAMTVDELQSTLGLISDELDQTYRLLGL